ncbi:MAG: hypothetical protein ACUVV6_01305 [Thermoplasmatota archaeon]
MPEKMEKEVSRARLSERSEGPAGEPGAREPAVLRAIPPPEGFEANKTAGPAGFREERPSDVGSEDEVRGGDAEAPDGAEGGRAEGRGAGVEGTEGGEEGGTGERREDAEEEREGEAGHTEGSEAGRGTGEGETAFEVVEREYVGEERRAAAGISVRDGSSHGLVNSGGGRLNGLRNRRGLTNGRGISNGIGLVNGSRNGLINGGSKGITNGRGIVNGRSVTNDRELELAEAPPRRPMRKGWVAAIAVIVVMVLVTVAYYALVSPEKGVVVDGQFSDWAGVFRHTDEAGDQSNPDINIRECALILDESSASFYLRVEGRALSGRGGGIDSFYFFLDTDRSPSTGYPAQSVGAEFVLIVDGYEGRVSACGLYKFSPAAGRPSGDWNSRSPVGSARAAASGRELEAQVPRSELGPGGGRLSAQVIARDGAGNEDFGPVFGPERSSLRLVWSRTGPAAASPGDSEVQMLRIELTAFGGSVRVSSLRVSVNEGTEPSDISRVSLCSAAGTELPGASGSIAGGAVLLAPSAPFELKRGDTMVLTVKVWIPLGAARGRAVGLSIRGPADIAASSPAVTVDGAGGEMTYVSSPGPGIHIDGAFLDWEGVSGHPDPEGDAAWPSVDLRDFRVTNDSATLFFYASVGGEMMGGACIPEAKQRPQGGGGGGGGPVALPVVTGEDAFFLFIDTDGRAETGYSGGGVPVGADYLAVVRGRGGQVTSRSLAPFTGGVNRYEWSWGASTEFPAAAGGSALEAGVPLRALGSPNGTLGLFYYTTDWTAGRDVGETVTYALQEGGSGRGFGAGDSTVPGPQVPLGGEGDDGPLHAPEFGELIVPVAGAVAAFALARRGRRRAADASGDE